MTEQCQQNQVGTLPKFESRTQYHTPRGHQCLSEFTKIKVEFERKTIPCNTCVKETFWVELNKSWLLTFCQRTF